MAVQPARLESERIGRESEYNVREALRLLVLENYIRSFSMSPKNSIDDKRGIDARIDFNKNGKLYSLPLQIKSSAVGIKISQEEHLHERIAHVNGKQPFENIKADLIEIVLEYKEEIVAENTSPTGKITICLGAANPDPKAVEILKTMRSQGKSYGEISEVLNDAGYRTPTGLKLDYKGVANIANSPWFKKMSSPVATLPVKPKTIERKPEQSNFKDALEKLTVKEDALEKELKDIRDKKEKLLSLLSQVNEILQEYA